MTKTENRAAARAYHQEREQQRRDDMHGAAVTADLEELRRLRNYLIYHSKARVPSEDLRRAIDDYVEKLTGDRTTLHATRHSIG